MAGAARSRIRGSTRAGPARADIGWPVDHAGPPPCVHLAAGGSVTWDSRVWKSVNLGERVVSLLGEDDAFTEIPLVTFEGLVREERIAPTASLVSSESKALQFLATASEDDLKVANRRYEFVQQWLNGERISDQASVPE